MKVVYQRKNVRLSKASDDDYLLEVLREDGEGARYIVRGERERVLSDPMLKDYLCVGCGKVYNELEYAVGQCNICDPFMDEDEGMVIE